jgi:hypothetical protein
MFDRDTVKTSEDSEMFEFFRHGQVQRKLWNDHCLQNLQKCDLSTRGPKPDTCQSNKTKGTSQSRNAQSIGEITLFQCLRVLMTFEKTWHDMKSWGSTGPLAILPALATIFKTGLVIVSTCSTNPYPSELKTLGRCGITAISQALR